MGGGLALPGVTNTADGGFWFFTLVLAGIILLFDNGSYTTSVGGVLQVNEVNYESQS